MKWWGCGLLRMMQKGQSSSPLPSTPFFQIAYDTPKVALLSDSSFPYFSVDLKVLINIYFSYIDFFLFKT